MTFEMEKEYKYLLEAVVKTMQALGTGLGYSRILPSNPQINQPKFKSWFKEEKELTLAEQELQSAENTLVANVEKAIEQELAKDPNIQAWLSDLEPQAAFNHIQGLKRRILSGVEKQLVNTFDILAYPAKVQTRLKKLADDVEKWELGGVTERAKLALPKLLRARWLFTDENVQHYHAVRKELGK